MDDTTDIKPPEDSPSGRTACSPFPCSIEVCAGQSVPVVVVAGLPELGHWDEHDQVIRIREEQPDAAKLCVLIHEMIHMAETQLIAAGVLGWFYRAFIRRIWGEQLVENLSSFLFQWMGCSGMLTGVTPAETRAFVDEHLREWGDKSAVVI